MMPNHISLGALAALVPLIALPGLVQDPREPEPSPLQRVAPAPEGDDQTLAQLYSRGFDPLRWRELLATGDLDRREHHFDVLVKRASFDPSARAFLEELVKDSQAGELSWTARLALRELGRARFPLSGFLSGDPFRSGRKNIGGAFEELLRDLMKQEGQGHLLTPPGWPRVPGSGGSAGGSGATGSSGRSVHLEQDDQGARVEIVETIDGQETTRTYVGSSLEEILAQEPELRGELGDLEIRVEEGFPFDLDFGLGAPREPSRGLRDPRLLPQRTARPLRTDKLGVMVEAVPAERASELLLDGLGLRVERSYPGTYAHLLGVVRGDVLIELDGHPLREVDDIESAMRERTVGDDLELIWIDQLGQRQAKTWRSQ